MTDNRQSKVIRASEIANYTYCARGWWLNRVRGYASTRTDRMLSGQEEHRSHGRDVVGYHRLRRLGYLLLALGGMIGFAVLCWWLASALLP